MASSEFKTTKFNVGMKCGGCSNAVKRIVNKTYKEAIGEVDANPSTNILTVKHKDSVTKEQILDTLKRWGEAAGKEVEFHDKEGGRRTRGKKRTRKRRKKRRKSRRKSRRKKRRRKKRTKRRR